MFHCAGGKGSSLNIGAVVGGVVGGLIVVVLIVIVTAILFWKLSWVVTASQVCAPFTPALLSDLDTTDLWAIVTYDEDQFKKEFNSLEMMVCIFTLVYVYIHIDLVWNFKYFI